MAEPLTPGSVLADADIEIVRQVGRGGMGRLYEARQRRLDRRVALKLIAPEFATDPKFRARFEREARTAAAIDHPNVLPVYDAGETADGRLYLVSRFVDGGDLEAHLDRQGPLPADEAVAILGQVAAALDAAHGKGLIHRDLKPANVLLEPRDGGLHAYLGDFGLARWIDASHVVTQPGAVIGTFHYMAPEQLRGEDLDGRVDVYAFGCLVYRCLVGSVPFPRNTREAIMAAHLYDPIPLPSAAVPELPAAFDALVERAMQKDRDLRARSAGALTAELRAQLATASPNTASTQPVPASLRARVALHAAGYALLWTTAYLAGRAA